MAGHVLPRRVTGRKLRVRRQLAHRQPLAIRDRADQVRERTRAHATASRFPSVGNRSVTLHRSARAIARFSSLVGFWWPWMMRESRDSLIPVSWRTATWLLRRFQNAALSAMFNWSMIAVTARILETTARLQELFATVAALFANGRNLPVGDATTC